MRKKFVEYGILFVFTIVVLLSTQQGGLLYSNYKVDDIANSDVVATKSITYVDEQATALAQEEALKAVVSVYDKDLTVVDETKKALNEFIKSLEASKTEKPQEKEKSKIDDVIIKNHFGFTEEEIRELRSVDSDEIKKAADYLTNKIQSLYVTGVREETVEDLKEQFVEDGSLYLFNSNIREILAVGLSKTVVVNETLNKEKTSKQKQQIIDDVNVVYKKVTKGEIIIRKDDKITDDQMQKLKALEIVSGGLKLKDLIRDYPLILVFTLLFHFYCKRFLSDKINNTRKYAFTFGTIALVLIVSKLIYNVFWFFIPMMTVLIVFALFWGKRFVIPAAIFIGVLISGEDYLYLMMSLVIGLSLSFLYSDFRRFTDAIKTGMSLGLIVAVAYTVITYSAENAIYLGTAFSLILAGVLAGVVANGIIPLVENALGVATIYKLTELNRYDHPILEQLYTIAKGTYEHSRNVGHLCSSASKRIGTNTLLLKVAALYHDLGKIDNPAFFIENSNPSDNIHNTIDPLKSAQIILNHPIRSVELCRKHNIPQAVIDLIESHHSDGVLWHFYQKAMENGENPNIEDYRYKTSKPRSKEQGILLLADSTEAYSRSLEFTSITELRKEITAFIYKKVQSGVLDECELDIKEIKICIEEFTSAIFATNHTRVKYNTDKVN